MAQVTFGVHCGPQDISLEELRRFWRFCDQSGFELVSVWDHFYASPHRPELTNGCFEALPLLTTAALDTQQCLVACLVFSVTYRHPAVLAKALTTVDHLSNGRLVAGLGAGWHVPEHTGLGIPFPEPKERLDRLSESVRVLRLLFDQAESTFEGRYYQLHDARNYPRPVQAHIPIIVGGGGEGRTMAIAARWADGSNCGYMSPAAYRHKNEVLDQWCEKFGRDPASVHRSTLIHWYLSTTGQQPGVQAEGSIHGSTQQVIDQLAAFARAGAQRISFAIRPPLDWDAFHLFVEDVMPAFR